MLMLVLLIPVYISECPLQGYYRLWPFQFGSSVSCEDFILEKLQWLREVSVFLI